MDAVEQHRLKSHGILILSLKDDTLQPGLLDTTTGEWRPTSHDFDDWQHMLYEANLEHERQRLRDTWQNL